jgi:heat shock protein HtpX
MVFRILAKSIKVMMNKKEVQGVIGHELSHIRNYDTRITVLASALR